MKIAFIMDPLDTVNTQKDTSFHLMLASHILGHEVFAIDQNELSFDSVLLSHATQVIPVVGTEDDGFKIVRALKNINLNEMDWIFVRKDPPFDQRYLMTTLMLDLLENPSKVINSPTSLRSWNEKLSALFFQKYGPEQIITSQTMEIHDFLLRMDSRCVLKPVDGHGGRGIHFVDEWSEEIEKVINQMTQNQVHPVVFQKAIPEASEGDKRILLWDGDPLGAILRVAAPGKEINNLDQGGHAEKSSLTDRDKEICAQLKPELIKHGLRFVGIDLLGPQLTEINVTSPTGLQELCRFSGVDHHIKIIESL